jgi:hypothetical protein
MYYGWWVLTACFIMGVYVAASVFWGFTAFFEPLVEEFKWSYAEVSFAASLRGLEMGILAPLVGFLVDRYSPRWILASGIAGVGLGLLILSQTTNLFTFYISILLLAFGAGGCTSVVHMSLMANWFKRRQGLAMGIMGSGFGCSGLVIPFIVDWVDTYGWRETLIGLSLGAWLICLPLCLVVRDRPEDMGLLPDGGPPEPKPAGRSGAEDACAAGPPAQGAHRFKSSCFTELLLRLVRNRSHTQPGYRRSRPAYHAVSELRGPGALHLGHDRGRVAAYQRGGPLRIRLSGRQVRQTLAHGCDLWHDGPGAPGLLSLEGARPGCFVSAAFRPGSGRRHGNQGHHPEPLL